MKTLPLILVLMQMASYAHGQTISASPNDDYGCDGDQVTYTFSYNGTGEVIGMDWDVVPSSAGSISPNGTWSRIVTWHGVGAVAITWAERINGVIYERHSERSFTAFYTAGTIAGPSTVCYGASGSFTHSGSSSGTMTWQRCVSGCSTTNDDGWSTNTAENSFSDLTVTTSFRVKVTNPSCGGVEYSNIKTVTAEPDMSGASVSISNPFPLCGNSVLLNGLTFTSSISHTGGNPTYDWYRSSRGTSPTDDNESTDPSQYKPHYTLQDGEVIYCKVSYSYTCTVNNPAESNHVTVSLTQPQAPSVMIDGLPGADYSFCEGESVTFTASSAYPITSYQWGIGASGSLSTSSTFTVVAGEVLFDNDLVKLTATVSGGCLTTTTAFDNTSGSQITIIPVPAVQAIADTGPNGCPGGESDFSIDLSNPYELNSYQWSMSPLSAGSISSEGVVTWASSGFTGEATIKVATKVCNNIQREDSVDIMIQPRPSVPGSASLQYCDFEPVSLSVPGWTNKLNWYDQSNNFLKTGYDYLVPCKKAGSYTYLAEYISEYGCVSATTFPINVSVISACDDKLNTVETISYDADQAVVAHQKSYFGFDGRQLQSQVKSLTRNQVLTSQGIKDEYDREATQTLSAPVNQTSFQYKHWFVLNQSGGLYTYQNAGQPLSTDEGTVGDYYSLGNSLEENVPVTGYPFGTTEFYNDGTGAIKFSAGPGEVHRMGAGHEVLSGTFPVFNELNDYLTRRSIALPGITQDGSLRNEGVVRITRDQNGMYAISIVDKEGKNIVSARPGDEEDSVLSITNSITSSGDPSSTDYRPMTYFYILKDHAVTITGSTDFVVENIVTDEHKASGVTFAGSGGVWPAGFYRVLLSNPESEVTITYANFFNNISYQFYDDTGKLISSVSPNGYEKWKAATDPVTQYDSIDKTTYTYNFKGWLLRMNEPDAGMTEYVYRKDGKIRFSQNAEQRNTGRYSFTHYDVVGRPVESGEYTGSGISFVPMDSANFTSSLMEDELEKRYDQITWDDSVKRDWVRTYYDYPDEDLHDPNEDVHLPEAYAQSFVRGAVSKTENANIRTWYSYDELGRVTWMARKPKKLHQFFVVRYTYDFLGNVLQVANLSYSETGTLRRQFYHHYEYDDDQRLSKASTSLEASGPKKLRATYAYYLHGPLKRIELGDSLQGVDFVYNIQGWLTQINHPDPALDPGGDTNDVFGMVLDYYESDLTNLLTSSVGSPHDPARRHGLPANHWAVLTDPHQPLIRFAPEQPVPDNTLSLKVYSAENSRYKQMVNANKNK